MRKYDGDVYKEVITAFETMSLIERLRFVSMLITNRGYDGDDNRDPVLSMVVTIIDGTVDDLEQFPEAAAHPLSPLPRTSFNPS